MNRDARRHHEVFRPGPRPMLVDVVTAIAIALVVCLPAALLVMAVYS